MVTTFSATHLSRDGFHHSGHNLWILSRYYSKVRPRGPPALAACARIAHSQDLKGYRPSVGLEALSGVGE